MSDQILHSKRNTAAMLGISVRTLENLVSVREIVPRRIGRRVLFDAREIERFARRDHKTKQFPSSLDCDRTNEEQYQVEGVMQ